MFLKFIDKIENDIPKYRSFESLLYFKVTLMTIKKTFENCLAMTETLFIYQWNQRCK